MRKVLFYIEFLNWRIGKGIYILFVGLLTFNTTFKSDEACGIMIFLVGLFNIIVGFMN